MEPVPPTSAASVPILDPCPRCRHGLVPSMVRCSECGTDRAAFAGLIRHGRRDRRIARLAVACAAWPWVLEAMLLVLLCIARLELGRWPHRMGMDDPKGIEVVGLFMAPVYLWMMAMPLMALATVLLLAMLGVRRGLGPRIGRVWPLVVLAAGMWVVGFVLVRWDPAEALVWFMD